MTHLIQEAANVANTIAQKETALSEHRAELNVEADKFSLIALIAVEAVNADILRQRKGRKADAGEFLATVCFDVLGQKNKSGKGKKLAENAQRLAKSDDFAEVITVAAEAIKDATKAKKKYADTVYADQQESSDWDHAISEVNREVADICDDLDINSYNQLVAHLNPQEEISDEEKVIAFAGKLSKANGHDIDTVEGMTAVLGLLKTAAETAKAMATIDNS